ncbi:unnamed protein product, partial [Brenthis ino]
MSIIAVGGLPPKLNLKDVVKTVARPIHGIFEALNYGPSNKGRVCYLRLSEKLDPLQVVERINTSNVIKRGSKVFAFMPDHVPDLPLAAKPKKLPERIRRNLKIAPNLTRRQIIGISHEEIMKEMQTKYTGLYTLSAKTKHSLLRAIGQEVYNRIVQIMDSNKSIDSCFILTRLYRKKHPHFGDFQFILSTLHEIQDSQGKPRSQIQESDLIYLTGLEYTIHNIPFEKVTSILSRYTDKINVKIVNHINKLKENMQPENDSIEEAARLKVREQLVNMGPYLPGITREVIQKNFVPNKVPVHIVKIYGEPFLPNKDVLSPFVARHRGLGVVRSDYMYNTINVRVPRDHLKAMLAADGTLVGGSKLVIRPSTTSYFKQHFSQFEKDSEFEAHKMDEYNQRNAVAGNVNADWNEQW